MNFQNAGQNGQKRKFPAFTEVDSFSQALQVGFSFSPAHALLILTCARYHMKEEACFNKTAVCLPFYGCTVGPRGLQYAGTSTREAVSPKLTVQEVKTVLVESIFSRVITMLL